MLVNEAETEADNLQDDADSSPKEDIISHSSLTKLLDSNAEVTKMFSELEGESSRVRFQEKIKATGSV